MANSQSGLPPTYSFLVQSTSSSLHEVGISFDGSSTKQKRKRTSPHDHAILETAYQKNSKPDKNERADIVSQVELSEKEVQIWFQNRRQNDRRKAKPLQPHELLAHIRNSGPTQAPPNIDTPQPTQDKSEASRSKITHTSSADIPRPPSRSSSIHELLNPPSSVESVSTKNTNSSFSQYVELVPTPPSSIEACDKDIGASGSFQSTGTATDNQHTRKRSHEMMLAASANPTSGTEQPNTVCHVRPYLAKKSSFVRLAMTVDGAVKVRTNDETTPSPPKQRLPPPTVTGRRHSGLNRSHSAVEGTLEFKDINPPIRQAGQPGFGRSRDARTWEFYCDRDSSEALSTQIEAERNGSAVGAINLIRSNSQRNKMHALSPNLSKQNKKRSLADHNSDKPKLVRARSSMARMQGFDGATDLLEHESKRVCHDRSPSGDSDKENWAPGTRASHNVLRRMNASISRSSILQESDSRHHRGPRDSVISEGQENRAVTGKDRSKGDDLDCIQGLLSLSQGAWR